MHIPSNKHNDISLLLCDVQALNRHFTCNGGSQLLHTTFSLNPNSILSNTT